MMQSGEILQRCNSCGAGLTLEHMRGTECPYCKVVFPHHAQAAGHAALVNQIMAQQMGNQAQLQQQAIAQVFGGGAPNAARGAPPPAPGPGGAPPGWGNAPPGPPGSPPPGYGVTPPAYGVTPPAYGAPPAIYGLPTPGYVPDAVNKPVRTMVIIAVVGTVLGLLVAMVTLVLVLFI